MTGLIIEMLFFLILYFINAVQWAENECMWSTLDNKFCKCCVIVNVTKVIILFFLKWCGWLAGWPAGRLVGWLAGCWISSLFNVTLFWDVLFASLSSSSAWIMVLPKLSFVLLRAPFLSHLKYSYVTIFSACIMASVRDFGKCRAFLHYSLLGLLPNVFKVCSWKRGIVIQQCNRATHLLFNW